MNDSYNQMLILQLPGSSIKDYDAMIELEDQLIAGLAGLGKVSGHDMGVGEMNIFIRTNDPKMAFERIRLLWGTQDFMHELKAAYRGVDEESYTVLHPPGLDQFSVA